MNSKLSCVLCWLPLVLLLLAYIPLFIIAMVLPSGGIEESTALLISFFLLIVAVVAVIVTFAVMIWLIIKVWKDEHLEGRTKAIWIICLYMFNLFVFPVYWHKHIRQQ